MFWAISCELSYSCWNPHQLEDVNYMMTRLAPWHAAAILRTGFKEMGMNWLWNWRLTVLKTIKMMLVRSLMTKFKIMVRADRAISACSPPPSACKSCCPRLSFPHVASIQNKANFLFHQPGLFIGIWAVSCRTPLSFIKVLWNVRRKNAKFLHYL